MEESEVNALKVETVPIMVKTLHKATLAKLVTLPKPKVAQTRIGMISTCMAQIVLLDQKNPRMLKLNLENTYYCCTHSYKYCTTLAKYLRKKVVNLRK